MVSLNKALLGPYFLGEVALGGLGPLDCHEPLMTIILWVDVSKNRPLKGTKGSIEKKVAREISTWVATWSASFQTDASKSHEILLMLQKSGEKTS